MSISALLLHGFLLSLYRMAGNIGREFNLVTWPSSVGLPNFILPKLLHTIYYTCMVAQPLSPGNCWKCLNSLVGPSHMVNFAGSAGRNQVTCTVDRARMIVRCSTTLHLSTGTINGCRQDLRFTTIKSVAASFHNACHNWPPSQPNFNSANIYLSCLEAKSPNMWIVNISGRQYIVMKRETMHWM